MNLDQTKPVRLVRAEDENNPLTLDFVLTEVVRILDEERDAARHTDDHRVAA
jgi:hypothetical protein